MGLQYTAEQQAVLDATGKIIVSASAGSGKTFVMIERMINCILGGCDVDRMLAVTFTKKAATQMREKIRKKIIERINEPSVSAEERERLKEQLKLLPMAEISTIHSFCTRLIRTHFFQADIDGAFEVLGEDDSEEKELKGKAIEEVFAAAYDRADGEFLDLLDLYYRKKKDVAFRDLIQSLYEKLRLNDDYRDRLERLRSGEESILDEVAADLFARLRRECAYLCDRLNECYDYLLDMGNTKTVARIEESVRLLEGIAAQTDYFAACRYAKENPLTLAKERCVWDKKIKEKKEAGLPLNEEEQKKDFYQTKLFSLIGQEDYYRKNIVKPMIEELIESADREKEGACLDRSRETAKKLAKFILEYDECYTAMKRERAKLDYTDLELITLKLLSDESVAAEVRGRFDYIFVDEYQDVNPVQEKIVSLIGGDEIFLVGDVKQAIYAFRGSKSEYFTQKEEEYRKVGHALALSANFRSAQGILDTVNRVFARAMRTDTCGIAYAEKPMSGGSKYGDETGRVRLHLLGEEEKEESDERGVYSVMDAYRRQLAPQQPSVLAKTVYQIIEQERASTLFDADEGSYRPVRYGDIAILSRKKEGKISSVVFYLMENGIPVSSESQVNLCDFPEVRQAIDILSLLDNAEQDIPLCSALLSDMGGLNNDDLAKIRLSAPNGSFRRAAEGYSRRVGDPIGEKLRAFYERVQGYRFLSHVLSASDLLSRILSETGIEAGWLARERGDECCRRLHAFVEKGEGKNLHRFLEYLRDLDYKIPVSEKNGSDAVRVGTIHSSKGLEYPVVILVDLDTAFHGADRDEVLLSEKYGPAPKSYDREKRTVSATLLRRLIDKESREDELKGELNLLYVAMTRAQYALHVLVDGGDRTVCDPLYARRFSDLLPSDCFDKIGTTQELQPAPRRQLILEEADDELKAEIERAFAFSYPFAADLSLPVKSSASRLLQSEEDEYYRPYVFLPDPEEEAVEKNRVGTAYHAFLQYARFSADGEEELNRMAREKVLPEEQLSLLSAEKTKKILGMPVFKRLSTAELYREQPFLVRLPAKEIMDVPSDRETLFQGFIDLLAVTESGVEIVDYKYSAKSAESLKGFYARQLDLYRKAAAKILRIKEEKIRLTIVNIQRGEEISL